MSDIKQPETWPSAVTQEQNREEKLMYALAVAIIWATNAEGVSDFTRPYAEWAFAIRERIPGNPTMQQVLDAAISKE